MDNNGLYEIIPLHTHYHVIMKKMDELLNASRGNINSDNKENKKGNNRYAVFAVKYLTMLSNSYQRHLSESSAITTTALIMSLEADCKTWKKTEQ